MSHRMQWLADRRRSQQASRVRAWQWLHRFFIRHNQNCVLMCATIAASTLSGAVSSIPVRSPKLLLRRIFFLDFDRTKYLSVGLYPARGYEALLEFGGCKQTPIHLKEPQVQTLAVHLPVLCVEMCNDRQYSCGSKDTEFTLPLYRTVRPY
jgi:hypothetical protein